MIKRLATIFIALAALAFFAEPARAQMSDDAVYSYVEDGLASGKSQETIVKELATRGVTKAQAERIKKRLEDMHGTTDAVRSVSASDTRSRKPGQSLDITMIQEEMVDSVAVATAVPDSLQQHVYPLFRNIRIHYSYPLFRLSVIQLYDLLEVPAQVR